MSSVIAIFRRDGGAVASQEVDAMLTAVSNKHADGQRVWRSGCIALAHQHLWITPEEQGEEQPLTTGNGRFAISFDGRLDNRQELLQQLGLRSAEMRAATDAEIVLQSFIAWGERSVSRLLGDFAFVIWDRDERRLFIARDPLGVRQVAYYCDSQRCIVASTVAPILAHPTVDPRINEGKIAEYIAQHELNQEESFFQDVYFCPPAHYLTVSADKVKAQRYWLPATDRRIRHQNAQTYADEFLDLFRQSVAARLRVAGKTGVMLSSGMDSTSVAAIAHEELSRRERLPAEGLSSYTLAFDGIPDSDEQQNVRTFADHFGLHCNFIRVDDIPLFNNDPLPFMAPDHLMYIMTNPLSWPLCRQMQRDGVKVALHGAYGDTLFILQRYWAEDAVRDRHSHLAASLVQPHYRRQAQRRLTKRRLRKTAKQIVHRFPGLRKCLQTPVEMPHSFGISNALMQRTDLTDRLDQNALKEYYADATDLASVTTMHWDYFIHSSARFLQGLQELGMEGWDPFRERRLVEFVLTAPSYLAGMPGGANNKWLLRAAMRDILPEATRTQPRHSGPIVWSNEWFAGPESQKLTSILQDPLVVQNGYYSPAWITQRLAESRRRPQYDYELWRCACLELWLKAYQPDATATRSAVIGGSLQPA